MRKVTNLEKVKEVARALLYTDIEPTKFAPVIVQHPFTSTGVTMVQKNGKYEMVNIVENEQDLLSWRGQMIREIDAANSVWGIYRFINKPYRIAFLQFTKNHLSRAEFSSLLSDAWISSEYPNEDINVDKAQLVAMFSMADKKELMTEEEEKQLNALNERVTIYRGVTPYNEKNIKALSWTLSKDVAKWFAMRYNQEGTVYQAEIPKSCIFALYNGRNEAEVVINPTFLENVIINEEPTMQQIQM